MVREVASKSSDVAGDGTIAATVLAPSIVRDGAKAVAAGMNPMDLERGIDKAIAAYRGRRASSNIERGRSAIRSELMSADNGAFWGLVSGGGSIFEMHGTIEVMR